MVFLLLLVIINLDSGESPVHHKNTGPPNRDLISSKEVIGIIGPPSCTVLNFGSIGEEYMVDLDRIIGDLNKLDNPYEELLFSYGPGASKEKLLVGILSGAIISSDGKVLTLGHGIQSKSNVIYIAWSPSDELPRKLFPADIISVEWVVGDMEHARDAALLKFKCAEEMVFPYIRWGDSEKVKIGDIVYIISSPYGMPLSHDVGRVASPKRSRKLLQGALGHGFPGEYGIQISDAFVLQGSSGGIAANGRGEFIGLVLEFLWEKSISFEENNGGDNASEEELFLHGKGHVFHTGNAFAVPSNFLKKWVDEVGGK